MCRLALLLLAGVVALSEPNQLQSLPRLYFPRTPEYNLRREFGTVLYDSDSLIQYLQTLQLSANESLALSPEDPVLTKWAKSQSETAIQQIDLAVDQLKSLISQTDELDLAASLKPALESADEELSQLLTLRSAFESFTIGD